MKSLAIRNGIILGLLLSTGGAICGCGGNSAAQPRDAIVQFTEAAHDGDEERLLAVLEGSETQKKFLCVLMDFITVGTEFRDAFIKAYSEQAWKDFQDDSKAPKDGNATLTISDRTVRVAHFREAEIDERKNEAFCENFDDSSDTIRIVKIEESWRVDARDAEDDRPTQDLCGSHQEIQESDWTRRYQPGRY